MRYDTPLPDVAHMLPKEAARLLMSATPMTQEFTLQSVKTMLIELEETGVTLDPVQLEAVLLTHVRIVAVLHTQMVIATVAAATIDMEEVLPREPTG